MYLGDFLPGQVVRIPWSTNAKTGGSITRFVNGSVVVYKGADPVETTAGITDVEDFDSVTGVHLTSIDTSNSFYVPYEDYRAVLVGSNVDGEAVSAPIGCWSIMNRAASFLGKVGTVFSVTGKNRFQCADITEGAGFFANKSVVCAVGSSLVRQVGVIQTHAVTSGRADFTLTADLTANLVVGDRIVVVS